MKTWLIPCVTSGLLALAPEAAHAQYYFQTYTYPYMSYYALPASTYTPPPYYYGQGAYYYATVPDNRLFVGNNYWSYGQSSTSYYAPPISAYGTQALGYQTTPARSPILFVQPGPYYYTPAQEYTPAYYGFYDSTRFFRY